MLRFGFGARLEILAEAFAVEAVVELKNDVPGKIGEFRNGELSGVFLADLDGLRPNRMSGRLNPLYLNGGEGGIRTFLPPRS